MSKNIFNQLAPLEAFAVATVSASSTGTDYDRYNAGNPVYDLGVLVTVGSWTSGTYEFQLQHGDTTSTYESAVDFTEARAITAGTAGDGKVTVSTAANDAGIFVLGYFGSKRYVRLIIPETSAGAGVTVVEADYLGLDPRDAYTA